MNVHVRLDDGPVRGWIVSLLARIGALPGVTVTVDRPAAPRRGTGPEDMLLRIEALLARRAPTGWSAVAGGTLPCAIAPPRAGDLVLDLRGEPAMTGGGGLWRLSFDGAPGFGALLSALMDGRAPIAVLASGEGIVASARLGTEAHGDLLTMIEDALARTTTLIEAALRGLRPVAEDISTPPLPPLTSGSVAAHGAGRIVAKLGKGIERLRFRQPHWRVGWRRLDGPDLIDLGALPSGGWNDLPDDGTRFYADPFPIAQEGRTVLFVEDYPYATGKAVISAVEFGPDGPTGTPTPVLEEAHHLSYPFVFARDGEVWMVPESCAAGTVDLYRARRFPGDWVKEATLIAGLSVSDATLVEHDGRWWMLATCREGAPAGPGLPARGSFSDTLHLWSAPDFRGPWSPHPANPVLIDCASARPAGRVVTRGSTLVRPVQDCREGYGAALALARIDRLDGEGYAQTVLARLAPGPGWAGGCLHTLNRCGPFEFIDGAGRVPRRLRATAPAGG